MSSEITGVGEGLWRVLDNGYVKLTGKLTTAKNLGLENKTYPGTINVTFVSVKSTGTTTVDYEGKLFFKVIENQVVGLAIPEPNASKLSNEFYTDPDDLVSKTLTGSLVAYDQTRKAAKGILNFIDSEYKIWSKEKQDEVASSLGDIASNIDSTGHNFKKAVEMLLI